MLRDQRLPEKKYLMISILFWNIRGVGNSPSIRRLKKLVISMNISVIALQEPKIQGSNIEDLCRKLNFREGFSNISNKIWIMWKHTWDVKMISNSEQLLSVEVKHDSFREPILFSCVYAKNLIEERKFLWEEIVFVSQMGYNQWIVGGDFNVILRQDEKKGGNVSNRDAILDFHQAITNAGLLDLGPT